MRRNRRPIKKNFISDLMTKPSKGGWGWVVGGWRGGGGWWEVLKGFYLQTRTPNESMAIINQSVELAKTL